MTASASDPFERHGIDHLSPSSLRLFRDAPAVWIGKYLLKAPDDVGPAAWRGQAIEAAVDQIVFGGDGEAAVRAMRTKWDELALGLIEPDVIKEEEALNDFLMQAGVAFGGLPIPLQRQARMRLDVPGISVPLVGFCDYLWADRGGELKTTWRMPNGGQPDPDHVAQVSCYALHWGVEFSITYVTPKRWTRFDVTRPMQDEAWDRVIETAHAVRSLLAHVDSAHDALSMFAPDYTSFYFRPAMAEAVRAAKAARVLPGEPRKPELQVVES